MRQKIGLLFLFIALVPALVGCGGGGGGGSSSGAGSRGILDGAGEDPGGAIPGGGADPASFSQIQTAVFSCFGPDPASAAPRHGLYVTDQGRWYIARTVKAANPSTKLFVYEGVGFTANRAWKNDPIGYAWISQNHPEWLLKDGSGQNIPFSSYPFLLAVDPGDPEYQRVWAENAIAIATELGADGISIDNLNSRYDWNFHVIPVKYPDRASYAAAMDSFIRYVVPLIKQAGLQVIGNGSAETSNTGMWMEWNALTDGRAYEMDPLLGNGCPQEVDQRWLNLFEGFQIYGDKMNVFYVRQASEVGEQAQRYYVASYLLMATPTSYLGLYGHENEPIPDNALQNVRLGSPTETGHQVSGRIWARNYENGYVVINISASQAAEVEIPAGLADPDGNPVAPGARTLAAHDSLVLFRQ